MSLLIQTAQDIYERSFYVRMSMYMKWTSIARRAVWKSINDFFNNLSKKYYKYYY